MLQFDPWLLAVYVLLVVRQLGPGHGWVTGAAADATLARRPQRSVVAPAALHRARPQAHPSLF